MVRRSVGYDRWETAAELALLADIYTDLRLYVNFFQPVLKLIGKERIDDKTIKSYDQAKTPFRRVLAAELPLAVKARLIHQYQTLNPVTLRKRIDQKVAVLWKLVR